MTSTTLPIDGSRYWSSQFLACCPSGGDDNVDDDDDDGDVDGDDDEDDDDDADLDLN